MCVNYWALNNVTTKNKYLVPNATDLFDRLAKAIVFTKLDLRLGYWQVRVAERDEAKTTMVTRLREHKLYVKNEKYEFCRQEVMFLEHWVSNGKIRMEEKKVQAILDWSSPNKVAELRYFLGLANYYRNFIEGYSKKVSILTDLLKAYHKWVWTEDCQAAFKKLKLFMSSKPIFHLPKFNLPFEVHTDASDRALEGVLMQEAHPMAYESRKWNEAEQRYSAHEKEMVVVVHCLYT
ncbi:hypothetical protein LWI28_022502 [Acer negundo]|uniref:Reverse transcriptase/retrotransposon-derived protein RNase H-like domain-containing protein n=1 Tax=Acer negundo TaxID=4023 RepID=A0AAD5JE97_ACENE|nr:hypothetical protein LWI28_022502 [Acer negundo]